MLWCPDEAKIKAKMLYSSSFDALKKALTGVAKYVEVCVSRRTGPGRRGVPAGQGRGCRDGTVGGSWADDRIGCYVPLCTDVPDCVPMYPCVPM